MSENVENQTIETKVHKTRTSITLTPEIFKWAKQHADSEKISVSQLIEDLLESLQDQVTGS